MKPLFIVFEGLDGSGTSTQSRLLAEHMRVKSGTRAHVTTEPSEGPIGQLIRSALKGRLHFTTDSEAFDRQLAYLFAADRYDHLWNDADGIIKLLRNGEHVICTRYFFSSYAYHCNDDRDRIHVGSLNSEFPYPDAVIYIDVDVDVAALRLAERAHLDRYENADKLRKVKQNYELIFASYAGAFLRVQGSQSASEVHRTIATFIDQLAWP